MSRTPRPINTDGTTRNVLMMIESHQGKQCPTRQDIVEWTSLPRRKVWPFMNDLQERGLIEMEAKGTGDSTWRRMRIMGMPWTDWTQRRPPTRREQLMADAAGLEER